MCHQLHSLRVLKVGIASMHGADPLLMVRSFTSSPGLSPSSPCDSQLTRIDSEVWVSGKDRRNSLLGLYVPALITPVELLSWEE